METVIKWQKCCPVLVTKSKIIMNDDFVTYELAVKLKEKGYPQDVFIGHDEFGTICIGDEHSLVCDAPTISQVLKWLREKGIIVYIMPKNYTSEIAINVSRKSLEGHWLTIYESSVLSDSDIELGLIGVIEYVLDNLI